MRTTLDELDLPPHLLWFQAVAQEVQVADDLANRSCSLFRVHDPGVFVARRVMTQEVLILREDNSVVRQCKCDVLSVRSPNQTRVGCRCDIKTSQT
jgi:hypothetical protein